MDDFYLNKVVKNNITYSIDNLRLSTQMTFSEFAEIEFRFRSIYNDKLKLFYNNYNITGYLYNFNIEVGEGKSFWFGFLPNSSKKSTEDTQKYTFTIDFNPNKIKIDNTLLYILFRNNDWYIKSFDIACDIPVSILSIIFDKGLKREYKIFNNGYDDKTIYIGKGDNRVKIYNKKKESNLDIDTNLTRIEISVNADDFLVRRVPLFKDKIFFPDLYLHKYLFTIDDYSDKTFLAILYAVDNGFPLNDLSRVYRQRIKNLLKTDGQKIEFSSDCVYDVLRRVIYTYFANSKSPFRFSYL